MAFANTNTSENLISARDSLNKLGAVNVGENSASLTARGNDMLLYHNLVDNMGELTDEGQLMLDSSEEVGNTFNIQHTQESFKFLSGLKPR